jgi:hypothetical protein
VKPGDGEGAFREMLEAGAVPVRFGDLEAAPRGLKDSGWRHGKSI